LAPVMSFWIASPSMDPEIFFLSVATIGWQLAVWRLVGTLMLSLAAGFLTHYIGKVHLQGDKVLRIDETTSAVSIWVRIRNGWNQLLERIKISYKSAVGVVASPSIHMATCCVAEMPSGAQAGLASAPYGGRTMVKGKRAQGNQHLLVSAWSMKHGGRRRW
jgi:uncharacterized membrane protein YraQ (UPF0718 family)